jgi:DNA repair protein RecO (recombination protein O)
MLKKERVIVLRLIKNGESDLVVQVLNRKGARISFFAKAGLKSRKRFGGGVLEPTHYIEASYKERANDQLHTLLEAQLVQGFVGLRADYDRLQTALYFLKVTSKLSQDGAVDSQDMFDLLGNALKAAEFTKDVRKLKLHFEIKVLGNQGVLPFLLNAEQWMQKSLKDHCELELDKPEMRQLEWEIHHRLESYLAGE